MEMTEKQMIDLLTEKMEEMPFFKHTEMEIVSLSRDEFVGKIDVKNFHRNTTTSVHGGMLYTLMDTFAGAHAAVFTGTGVVTVNSHVEFLRPAACREVICRTSVLKLGRNFCRMQADLFDENDKQLCSSIHTYFPI